MAGKDAGRRVTTAAGKPPQTRDASRGGDGDALLAKDDGTWLPGAHIATPRQLRDVLSRFHVEMDKEGEPVLLRRDGSVVDTWREGYPYSERMTRVEYDLEKRALQIELLKLQEWIKARGEKVVILF